MRTRPLTVLLSALALVGLLASAAPALPTGGQATGQATGARTEEGAALEFRTDGDSFEAYLPAGDGITMLHADIIRPAGLDLTDADPTPVILTVSPYTSHNGATTTDTDLGGEGPSSRFYDFLDRSEALAQGYTYVMVDLPGFGGSGGCNDWGGLREQDAVRAAVEWAADQPWSTGKVGLLGKSYDGWTGLMGIAQQPRGLAAVAALEPVYAGYRYIYNNGIHRSNTVATITSFQASDAKPGRPSDTPQYLINGSTGGWCYGINILGSNVDFEENGPYWRERNLLLATAGRTTPLFLTQGFLETNTLQDGAFQYFNGLAGEDNRAWYGQFDHVRGWEQATERQPDGQGGFTYDGAYLTGRDTFIAELMRFYDEHLKGIEPDVADAPVVVQDSLGRYRDEEQWPPADSTLYRTSLNAGTYADSGTGNLLTLSGTEDGIWTVSEPLTHDVWLAGEPTVTIRTDAAPGANVAVGVYDIDEDGAASLISRSASILAGTGSRTTTIQLNGQDWPIEEGHQIGVLVTDADTNRYTHVATRTAVDVLSADIALPFLTDDRAEFGPGEATGRLEAYRASTGRTAMIDDADVRAFTLPGPLQ